MQGRTDLTLKLSIWELSRTQKKRPVFQKTILSTKQTSIEGLYIMILEKLEILEVSRHLLKDVLVVYVLEHCDEAGQFVLHLVLRHSLCRLLQQIVTVFRQLDGDTRRDTTRSRHCVQ